MNNINSISHKRQSIIITGSSRGLGAAIAKEICFKNYFYYGLSSWNNVDVSNFSLVKECFEEINETDDVFLPNCLVNNAGVCIPGNILEFSENDYNAQFGTNVLGILNCTQLYTQLCIKNKIQGKIINIASTAGVGPRPGRSIYAASKAAVISLSLSLSEELREHGIKVYCICPSAFDSDMRREIAPDDDFEKMIKPAEIANFIIKKIILDNSNFLDNQVIYIRR